MAMKYHPPQRGGKIEMQGRNDWPTEIYSSPLPLLKEEGNLMRQAGMSGLLEEHIGGASAFCLREEN